MCRNPIQKEFLKSHDGLLSHQLTSTGQSVAFFGACLVSPQKAIVQFQKFFFIRFLPLKNSKIYFFQGGLIFLSFITLILTQCSDINLEIYLIMPFFDDSQSNHLRTCEKILVVFGMEVSSEVCLKHHRHSIDHCNFNHEYLQSFLNT